MGLFIFDKSDIIIRNNEWITTIIEEKIKGKTGKGRSQFSNSIYKTDHRRRRKIHL